MLSSEVPIEAKARTAITVAPSSGIMFWLTTSEAALIRSIPRSIRTCMPSMMTIALSTSMPSAMISAPREIRSRMTPCICMKMKVPKIVRNRIPPMMAPLLIPMKIISTTNTIATASSRFTMKPLIEAVTASDCIEMASISMPRGVWAWSWLNFLAKPSPIVTTLPPETVEIPRAMAGLPS